MKEPLINVMVYPIDLVESYKIVRDYWVLDEGWRWTALERKLPCVVLDKLATFGLLMMKVILLVFLGG